MNVGQPRRLAPRIIDTDWLVLRAMQGVIAAFAARIARSGDVVIDFGCGEQPYAKIFADLGCAYRGADLGGEAELVITPQGRLIADDAAADLVTSFQVLEHVRDLDLYFAEARRVVRDEGWMILSTHGNWLYHPHPEDHRRWTREGLVNEIEMRDFDVMDCTSLVGPLAWTTMMRLTAFSFAIRKLPVLGRPLSIALAILMNARAWVEDRLTPEWATRDNACVYVVLCRPRTRAAAP
jgi:SAM-dependent methyltransferase